MSATPVTIRTKLTFAGSPTVANQFDTAMRAYVKDHPLDADPLDLEEFAKVGGKLGYHIVWALFNRLPNGEWGQPIHQLPAFLPAYEAHRGGVHYCHFDILANEGQKVKVAISASDKSGMFSNAVTYEFIADRRPLPLPPGALAMAACSVDTWPIQQVPSPALTVTNSSNSAESEDAARDANDRTGTMGEVLGTPD